MLCQLNLSQRLVIGFFGMEKWLTKKLKKLKKLEIEPNRKTFYPILIIWQQTAAEMVT